jgi:K+-transporting ATPase KdpF subunit
MSVSPIPFAALSGADVFGLVVSTLTFGYLLYALLRGEKL